MFRRESQSAKIALGGVTAALAVVWLCLGGLVPLATYACPMLASFLLLPLRRQLGLSLCVGWWALVSVLAVLLCPDRETAAVFVFLGWYPLAKPGLERLPRLPRFLAKLLLFNLAAAAMIAVLIFVFRLESLVREAEQTGALLLGGILLLANLCFFVYDLVLARVGNIRRGA